jgi:hypothetical protein
MNVVAIYLLLSSTLPGHFIVILRRLLAGNRRQEECFRLIRPCFGYFVFPLKVSHGRGALEWLLSSDQAQGLQKNRRKSKKRQMKNTHTHIDRPLIFRGYRPKCQSQLWLLSLVLRDFTKIFEN